MARPLRPLREPPVEGVHQRTPEEVAHILSLQQGPADVFFVFPDSRVIPSHRAALCHSSRYMRRMLSPRWNAGALITINETPFAHFRLYIDYLTCAPMEVNTFDRCVILYHMGHVFVDRPLTQFSHNAFETRIMNNRNCEDVFYLAQAYDDQRLINIARDFARDNNILVPGMPGN